MAMKMKMKKIVMMICAFAGLFPVCLLCFSGGESKLHWLTGAGNSTTSSGKSRLEGTYEVKSRKEGGGLHAIFELIGIPSMS